MAYRDCIELDEFCFRELRILLDNEKPKTLVFGFVRQPKAPLDLSKDSFKYPNVFAKLMRWGEMYCGIPFTTIQLCINKKPKNIKNSEGEKFIVGFGSYTGSELVVNKIENNIRHRPHILAQSTEYTINDITNGYCYILLFYSTSNRSDFPSTKRLSQYEGLMVDNEWKISYRELGVPVVFYDKSGFPKTYKPIKYVEEAPVETHANLLPIHRLMAIVQEEQLVSNST